MNQLPADIFGGTFDPVQQGHLSLIKTAITPERVLVVAPTTQNPWKDRDATDMGLRVEMLRIAFKAEGILFSEDNPVLGQVYLCLEPYTRSFELLRWWRARFGSDNRWLVGPGDKESSKNWINWEDEGCEVIEFGSDYPYHSSHIRDGVVTAHPAIQDFIRIHGLYR